MSLFITNNSSSIQKMKIVVTRSNKKSQSYEITVMDGSCTIHQEAVVGIKKRDEVVWKLADLYGAVEIENINSKDTPSVVEFKFTKIPVIPVVDDQEAELFFESHLNAVYDRIVQAVLEGIHAKRTEIRLFELSDTGVYFTSQRVNWKSGLVQALNHYISVEQYEKCIAVQDLINKL